MYLNEPSIVFTQVRYIFSHDIEIITTTDQGCMQKAVASFVHTIKLMKHKEKHNISFPSIITLLL